ncbi:MAG: polyprenyl synthetase family protein, partial [Verrucomicrobiae bacterium]|nr:polyprenyl synthetase family protein [Verrucomicrobiae bacterium]
ELRRAADCTHRLYGENTTILAALGFINQAYFHLWQLFAQRGKEVQNEAANLSRQCLGFEGILDGQSKDMNYYFVYNDGSLVSEIAIKKTGSLIRLCLMLPAILTEASRYEKFHLSNLADDWGKAYQIADDLKDIYYGEGVSGKTTHRDAELCRPNMALAIGESAAASILNGLLEKAEGRIAALEKSNPKAYPILRQFQTQFTEKAKPLLLAFAAA